MTILILGLILFLGLHSVRIVAEDWRNAMRARLGEGTWKGLYSLAALVGFGLIVYGFGLARANPVVLWAPPVFMRHVSAPFVMIALIFLAAAYVPRNGIKARLHHPMTLGVKMWAAGHLLANGMLHDVVLFASFLLWSVLCFRAARRRDAAAGTVYPAGTRGATIVTILVGVAAWWVFAFWLHALLIGVRPLP